MGLNTDVPGEGDREIAREVIGRPSLPKYPTTSSFGSSAQANGDADDELPPPSPMSIHADRRNKAAVVVPDISVKSEFTTIGRKRAHLPEQTLSCLVTVEVPSSGARERYDAASLSPIHIDIHVPAGDQSGIKTEKLLSGRSAYVKRVSMSSGVAGLSTTNAPGQDHKDPFSHIMSDLRSRMVDYRGSGVDKLGKIRLFDILQVRKGGVVVDISVYLFQYALVCVTEEKRKNIRSFLHSSPSFTSLRHSSSDEKGNRRDKGILKLKGRIYFKHVKRVVDSSISGELSLTISMEDENVDSFILAFRDKSSLELWRKTILEAVQEANMNVAQIISPVSPATSTTTSVASKLTKMGFDDFAVGATQHSPDSISHDRREVTTSSAKSSLEHNTLQTIMDQRASTLPIPLLPRHTPLDLIIVCSVPSSFSMSSSATLKVRLIRTALEHAFLSLGPLDRLSLVTYENGRGGNVRKTPFVVMGRVAGRNTLEKFLATLGTSVSQGTQAETDNDEFDVPVDREILTDMITGINIGLDKLLQRKTKNPVGGLILIHDGSETVKRAAMDLVLARAESAK